MSIRRLNLAQRQRSLTLETMAATDTRLSFRARGLHAFLMTQPDDYDVTLDRLARESPTEGKDALRPALQELLQAGYLHRTRGRSTGGTLHGWETTVYETPALLPGALDFGPPLGGRHPAGRQNPEAVPPAPLDLVPMPVEGSPSVVMGLHVADTSRPAEGSCTPHMPRYPSVPSGRPHLPESRPLRKRCWRT